MPSATLRLGPDFGNSYHCQHNFILSPEHQIRTDRAIKELSKNIRESNGNTAETLVVELRIHTNSKKINELRSKVLRDSLGDVFVLSSPGITCFVFQNTTLAHQHDGTYSDRRPYHQFLEDLAGIFGLQYNEFSLTENETHPEAEQDDDVDELVDIFQNFVMFDKS